MKRSGKLVADILRELTRQAKAGVSLIELDRAAEKMTRDGGAIPSFKGYMGYQHTLCTSVNEQVVHGIPSQRKLVDGDIVGLDFGLQLEGYHADSAVTVPIGKIRPDAWKLMEVTRNSLFAGIRAARAGNSIRDVSRAVEKTVTPFGFGIVKEFVGHGIGQKLHEDPQVPNYEAGAPAVKLRPGMTIAIEPMINLGTSEVKVLSDKWTAVTTDGSLSAHFEHTIAITEGEPEILTYWEEFGKYESAAHLT